MNESESHREYQKSQQPHGSNMGKSGGGGSIGLGTRNYHG